MNWLTCIDKLYANTLLSKNNKLYIYYPVHNLIAKSENVSFVLRKQGNKTKILFEDNYGRKLYLTDVDIISILVNAPEEIFVLMQLWLREYEQNKIQNKMIFEIENHSFEIFTSFPIYSPNSKENLDLMVNCTFKCLADYDVSYYDLMLLISLIVDKEYIVSEENGSHRKSRQLKKFIVLSCFYRRGEYIEKLVEKKYPVDIAADNVYYNSTIAKKIDLIFDDFEY